MDFRTYVGAYLHEVLGMETEAAKAHLLSSPLGADLFRAFRVRIDFEYDDTKFDLGPAEEPVYGRVTFWLKDGETGPIKDAEFEYPGWGTEWVKPQAPRWPPGLGGLWPGEVFILGAPTYVGHLPARRELQTLEDRRGDPFPRDLITRGFRQETIHVLPDPAPRGWFFEDIKSEHWDQREDGLYITKEGGKPEKYVPPPPKPHVFPRFMDL